MRTTTARHRLLAAALLLFATACDGSDAALEPSDTLELTPEAGPEALPAPAGPAGLEAVHWADGYVFANDPFAKSYTPGSGGAFNGSGGSITISRPGATGRYVVRFSGLSSLLTSSNTVHVTSHGDGMTYCKPMSGSLAHDKVEVRCFQAASGLPVAGTFSVLVLGRTAMRGYAFANQPTAASYTAPSTGSHNPAGTTTISRGGTGTYQVVFNSLGSRLAGQGGNVQVNSVASGGAHCKLNGQWSVSTNITVNVQCYSASGGPVDAKFSVLVLLPAPRLGYTYAAQQTVAQYTGDPYWSTNPDGGAVIITRISQGVFDVEWPNALDDFIEYGNIQVTALGYDAGQCKISTTYRARAGVKCFAANGAAADLPFTVMLGS